MIAPVILAAAAANSGKGELSYVWGQATVEATVDGEVACAGEIMFILTDAAGLGSGTSG